MNELAPYILCRSQLPETPRFTSEIERDVGKANQNMNAVFNKSRDYTDEGRVMASQQDRCAHDRSALLQWFVTMPQSGLLRSYSSRSRHLAWILCLLMTCAVLPS